MSAEMRNHWYWVGLLATGLALIAGVAMPRVHSTANGPLLGWFVVAGLLGVAFACFGRGTNGRWIGALIDDRNRVSVSRIQMAAWTIMIISAVFTLAADNIAHRAPEPLNITVPEELWVLMGISWISFAGSQLIKSTQLTSDVLEPLNDVRDANLVDIVRAEKRGQEDQLDLGKIQMLLLTLVVITAYVAAIAEAMSGDAVVRTLPALNGSIVTLLAISHAGYLTYKSVPSGQPRGAGASLDRAPTDGIRRPTPVPGVPRTPAPPREPSVRI